MLLSSLLFTFKLVLVVYRVTLADQTTYDAKVVGFDQDKDVAVLRVNAPKDKLKPIPIGVSADLLVGQKVYAIGNPVSIAFVLWLQNKWDQRYGFKVSWFSNMNILLFRFT